MSVFSRVKGFFSRHRNKFIVGGVLVTGSVLLSRYAQQKLREWQSREMHELLERNRKQQHFNSMNRTCNQTLLNLHILLDQVITKLVNTEAIVESLRDNPGNKIELWNNLKVKIFTKACCTIYATVMLVVTFKIQMSIIGGYMFKDPEAVPAEVQEKYLLICQDFLNVGIEDLTEFIDNKCQDILGVVSLKEELKVSDLEALFWSLQVAITTEPNSPIEKLLRFILLDFSNCTGIHAKIMRDTRDLLESDEVKSLATHCLNRGFLLLIDQISEFYSPNGVLNTNASVNGGFDSKKKMAKLIPIINGLLAKMSFPDSFLQQLISYEKLLVLSANVYESFL